MSSEKLAAMRAMREELEKAAAKSEKKSVLRGALQGAALGLTPTLAGLALAASSAKSPKDLLKSMALIGATSAVVGGGIGALGTHASNKYPSRREELEKAAAEDQKCLRAVLRLTERNPDLKVMIGPPDKGYDTSHFWAEDSKGSIHDPTRSDYSNYGKGSSLNMKANKKFLSSLTEKTAGWAKDDLPPPPPKDMSKERKSLEHPAATLGKSVAGLGAGMTAGYLGMKGVDEALKLRQLKAGVPKGQLKGVGGAAKWAVPASTAVLGMATPYFYQATVDKMRDNFKKRREGGGEREDS